jgi:hypothetical protein
MRAARAANESAVDTTVSAFHMTVSAIETTVPAAIHKNCLSTQTPWSDIIIYPTITLISSLLLTRLPRTYVTNRSQIYKHINTYNTKNTIACCLIFKMATNSSCAFWLIWKNKTFLFNYYSSTGQTVLKCLCLLAAKYQNEVILVGYSSTTFSAQLTARLCDMARHFKTDPTEYSALFCITENTVSSRSWYTVSTG